MIIPRKIKKNVMMKQFFLLLLTIIIVIGCSTEELDYQPIKNEDTRSSGELPYDLLGYGYDITGEFGVPGAKARVIDVKRLDEENPTKRYFEKNIYRSTTQKYTSGTDIADLTYKLGVEASLSRPATAKSDEIGAFLGANFNSTNSYRYVSAYSETFATYGTLFKKIDLNADIVILKQYLDERFVSDAKTMNPDKFIEKYGTHVLGNEHLGGVLKMFYHSKSTETKNVRYHKAGFQFAVSRILNLSFGGDYTMEEVRKNTQQKFKVTSVGGSGSLAGSVSIDKDGNVSQTFSATDWLKSIDERTSVMIGADKEKVYPIYDFVPENRKTVIKQAYEKYINSKVFDVVNTGIEIPYRQINGPGNSSQGGGVAVTDLDKNGQPDLILMCNDNNTPNKFWYWVIYDVDLDGRNGRQSQRFQVPVTVSNTNSGAAIALGDINRNGKDDILFMALDRGSDGRSFSFRYVIGWDIKPDGNCTSFSPACKIGTNMGTRADGAGVALYDINGNGRLDLVLMLNDAPKGGKNQFRYKIFYDLSNSGNSWSSVSENYHVPVKFGTQADGAGITIGNIDLNPRPEIILTAYDDPDGYNNFRYMVLHNVDRTGNPATITPYWTYRGCGNNGAGADAQLCDIDGNGIPDLFFMCVDASTPDSFRYYIGHDLNSDGELGYIR